MSRVYTLSQNGAATDWMNSEVAAEPFVVTCAINGTLTVSLEISNDRTAAKADAVAVQSYSASFAKTLNRPLPRRFRYRVTSYTNGSAVIGIGPAVDSKQNQVEIPIEGSSNQPTGNF